MAKFNYLPKSLKRSVLTYEKMKLLVFLQRDKLGNYFLWGKNNNKPVYQHESGLDFMYYHTNHVWGVGPKVGGNSAGLLNFGRQPCPYDLVSPWEFGTRQQNGQRQTDMQLKLVCLDQTDQAGGLSLIQNPPAPIKAGMDLVMMQ